MTKFLGCIVLVILIFLPFETPALKLMAGEDEINQVLELMSGSGNPDLVNWAGYGEEKLSVVTITGRVVCRDPCYTKTADVQLGSLPVSGATVAISCGSGTYKVSTKSWIRATTDENGDYSIELPSHLHAIPNLDKVCFAKLLHLPKDSLCRRQLITRKQMIKLLLSSTEEDGVRAYVADTMHLKHRSSKKCNFAGAV